VWEGYIETLLQRMFATSRRGFGVNFVQAIGADEIDDDPATARLYRTTPGVWAAYCEREFAATVEVISNYGMKEFTMLVRRRPDAASPRVDPSH
jgi:hypothetical protein